MPAPASIPRLVLESGDRFGDREALVDGQRRLSFAELATAVRAASAAVIATGVDPGDRIGLWAPNSLEWVVSALGLLGAGAVLVPLNTRFKGDEAAYILAKSGARMAFVAPPFLGADYPALLGARRAELPALGDVVSLDPSGWAEFLDRGRVVSARTVQDRTEAVGSSDIGDIIFTSGTTGKPKGVMTSHGQTLRVFDVWADVVGLEMGDRYLIVNPFFHTFGYKAGILAALLRGATMIPEPIFDVTRVLDRIDTEQVTVLPGPPTLYQSILASPERPGRDLGSLRLAVTGAAVVPEELVERMRTELKFSTVLTAYGLTEATGVVSMCRAEDGPATIAATSGRAIPETEVRVVGDAGQPLPIGEPGEVQVRGYNVMRGYFEDPEATAATVDADGWLHTGDVGVLDRRGYLRITDRLKDMYVVGGFNAYPAEIEQVLAGHPAVAESAVVGEPDVRLGEIGRAFVVPRPGASVDPEELVEWCKQRLANYKVPRAVTFVTALPRNASGKVLKYELRQSR